jgi:hypothetical protein
MSHTTTRATRKLAIGSALAVAVTAAAWVPAHAASSAPLDHSCTLGGNPIGNVAVTHTVPDTVIYGGTIDVTSTFTLSDPIRDALYGGTIRSVSGPSTTQFKIFGQPSPLPGSVPATPVTNTSPLTITVNSPVPLPDAAPIGIALDFVAGDGTPAADLSATLAAATESGAKLADVPLVCTSAADGSAVGSVKVLKAGTETAADLVYKKKSERLVAKAVVSSPSSFKAAGDVRFVLTRAGKKVGSKVATLKSGRALVSFKQDQAGTYKLKATYLGDDHFTRSKDAAKDKI